MARHPARRQSLPPPLVLQPSPASLLASFARARIGHRLERAVASDVRFAMVNGTLPTRRSWESFAELAPLRASLCPGREPPFSLKWLHALADPFWHRPCRRERAQSTNALAGRRRLYGRPSARDGDERDGERASGGIIEADRARPRT